MGCGSSKENIIVQVSYCGGVGWTLPAKRVCDSIKSRLPRSVIDCRPQQVFTGYLEVNLLVGEKGSKEKMFVYKGDKDTVLANVQDISKKVQEAYEKV